MANPLLPIRTNNNIQNGYVAIKPSDQVFVNFETSSLQYISSISGTTVKGTPDHNIEAAPNESLCAITASWSGSNSGYWLTTRKTLADRGFGDALTSLSGAITDIGIFALRKKMFDVAVVQGSITATATGVAYGGEDIKGDYYDSGSGALIQKSSGNTVGSVLLDEGILVVTTSSIREVATSITAISFKSRVQHTNLNIFCKCPANELNFTLNQTSIENSTISSTTDVIEQSYNNLLTKSVLTGSTERFKYWADLVSSGHKFSPIISHVGLYNDDNDLLAVAKFTRGIKKPTSLPISVRVSIDI